MTMDGPHHAGRRERDRTSSASLGTDERAVSPVIGGILMFSLAVALLAILQTTAVPAVNGQAEFQHSERVQTDMAAAEAAIERTAATGTAERVTIETGLRYPSRMLFVNPPPVSGTVRTTEPGAVELANARSSGETGDHWNGSTRTVETSALAYRPDYNEYRAAPATVAEPWVTYSQFDGTARPLTEQGLVDGRRLSLVALEGTTSRSTAGTAAIDVRPTSPATRTVTVRDAGEPIRIAVPTALDGSAWRELLAAQTCPDEDGDDRCDADGPEHAHVLEHSVGVSDGRLTLELERDATYELRLGAVTVGTAPGGADVAYLADVEGDATAVPEGGRQRLVVEARDRLDNPVSGVSIAGEVEGDGRLRAVDPVTGTDGRATFAFEAPADVGESRTVDVTLAVDGERDVDARDDARRTVAFEPQVTDLGGSRGNSGERGPAGRSGG